MKKIIVFWVFLMIFIMGCDKEIIEVEEIELDERCEWDTGRCTGFQVGWYFDSRTNRCTYFENKACTSPPFDAKQECEIVCLSS